MRRVTFADTSPQGSSSRRRSSSGHHRSSSTHCSKPLIATDEPDKRYLECRKKYAHYFDPFAQKFVWLPWFSFNPETMIWALVVLMLLVYDIVSPFYRLFAWHWKIVIMLKKWAIFFVKILVCFILLSFLIAFMVVGQIFAVFICLIVCTFLLLLYPDTVWSLAN